MPNQGFYLPDDEALAFAEYVRAIYLRAERAVGEKVDRFFQIGERIVRLRFAGNKLISNLTPAISHLSVTPHADVAFTVNLWDSTSTGSQLPFLLSQYIDSLNHWWEHLGPRGEVKQLTTDRIHTAYHLGPNILSVYDKESREAFYWVFDGNNLPYYELGSPLRTIFNWWMAGSDYQFVHAGAVGIDSKGVLLARKGGSGKSTTALICLEAGLEYASDDYCLIKTNPKPSVYSIYNTAKLVGQRDIDQFPKLADLIENPLRNENDKAMIFLSKHFPQKVRRSFDLRAVLLPTVTGKVDTFIRKASPGRALTALAPSTIFQLPGAGKGALKSLSDLIRQVPCYGLELGTDFNQIPDVISRILDGEQQT